MSEKKRPVYIKIKDEDNVAITVDKVLAGAEVMPGVVASQDIPQGHSTTSNSHKTQQTKTSTH